MNTPINLSQGSQQNKSIDKDRKALKANGNGRRHVANQDRIPIGKDVKREPPDDRKRQSDDKVAGRGRDLNLVEGI